MPPASKPWFVYLVRCSDGSIYTGITDDLDARLRTHNAGKGAKYTSQRRPVDLLYSETHSNQSSARKREIQLKRWTKRRKEDLAATRPPAGLPTPTINYEGRRFRGVVNYDDGDLTQDTLFVYHQQGDIVWGEYSGGGVARGFLIGAVAGDGRLTLLWQYASRDGRLVGGTCVSRPEALPDGRLRLHEEWIVTHGGDQKGSSVIEEVTA